VSDARYVPRARAQAVPYDENAKRTQMRAFLSERRAQAAMAAALAPTPRPTPKRVLILSSDAGSGHAAAARAVQLALGADYKVIIERPFDLDVSLPSVGPVRGVDFYNMVQAHGPPIVLDLLGGFQRLAAPMGETLHGPVLAQLMDKNKPDLVVTVVPMGNGAVFKEADARNVPLLVVPTDLDFGHFVDQIRTPGERFKLALPFGDMRTQAAHLPESAFAVTGYPVRPDFCAAEQARSSTLDALEIGPADKVVMIMMGGGGTSSDRVIANAQLLGTSLGEAVQGRVHIVCVCGRNDKMRRDLGPWVNRSARSRIRVHALGSCDGNDVAALMHKADVLITKPGGASVNEALAANLPQIYDRSVHAPFWELGNAAYAQAHAMGDWVDPKDMVAKVAAALARGKPRTPAPNPARSFPQRIRSVVDELTKPRDKR